MYLISLSPDILDEVFQMVMKLYLLITWVRNSSLIQDYKIFEDMHHGITINREFLKNKFISALWVCGVLELFQICFICSMHELHEVFVLECTILK